MTTTTTNNSLQMEAKTTTPVITDYSWNGTTYYQIDGKGESFCTYGLAHRALTLNTRKAA